jgi:hypothetical protein
MIKEGVRPRAVWWPTPNQNNTHGPEDHHNNPISFMRRPLVGDDDCTSSSGGMHPVSPSPWPSLTPFTVKHAIPGYGK